MGEGETLTENQDNQPGGTPSKPLWLARPSHEQDTHTGKYMVPSWLGG